MASTAAEVTTKATAAESPAPATVDPFTRAAGRPMRGAVGGAAWQAAQVVNRARPSSTPRSALRALLPLALALGCQGESGPPSQGESPASPPNVVVWLVDTLRADHLSCYGYERETSPRLDALAADGVLFEDFHVHANWTLPSVASLFSGRYPPIFGEAFDVTVPDDLVPLSERLSDAGWRTAGFTTTIATAAAFGFDRGFDLYRELDAEAGEAARRMRRGPDFDADRVVDAALGWLDDAGDDAGDGGRPFLLHLHSVDPHVPYEPHAGSADFRRPYDGALDGLTETLRDAMAADHEFSPEDVAHLVDLYDGEIAYNDAQLGRLVDGLTERGLLEDTLLVVLSDHGEEFFDRSTHGHGHRNLHAELTAVPLVMHWPAGLPGGARVDGLVRGIDLLPTLLELLGLPPAEGVDGDSVAEAARSGASVAGRDAPLFAHRSKEGLDVMALRTAALLYHADPTGLSAGLFDLREDPGAEHDLREEHPGREDGPRSILMDWLRARGRRDAGERQGVALDAETQAALRALGYLGDEDG
jgi:arylsulfatase A-like enzyme